jgi:hypothetical protein
MLARAAGISGDLAALSREIEIVLHTNRRKQTKMKILMALFWIHNVIFSWATLGAVIYLLIHGSNLGATEPHSVATCLACRLVDVGSWRRSSRVAAEERTRHTSCTAAKKRQRMA